MEEKSKAVYVQIGADFAGGKKLGKAAIFTT